MLTDLAEEIQVSEEPITQYDGSYLQVVVDSTQMETEHESVTFLIHLPKDFPFLGPRLYLETNITQYSLCD